MTELRQENSGASSWEGGTPGFQGPGEVGLCQQVGQNRHPGACGPGHPDHCILARGSWPPFLHPPLWDRPAQHRGWGLGSATHSSAP